MASVALPALAVQAQVPAKLEGTWQGAVRQPDGSDNRWVVKIETAGAWWKGTLWFIDQKSSAIPIGKVELNGSTLSLNIERVGITYEGKMAPDGNTIAGTRKHLDATQGLTAGMDQPRLAYTVARLRPNGGETRWAS